MISVIIPVYNAAKYLAKTIASVQAQTFTEWEIVLVDDGSKDNSIVIAEEICRQDRRISLFSQKNAGAAAARNYGLAEANPSYPYALCLDSDDLLLPCALQVLLTVLEACPEAPAVCGFLQDIDSDDTIIPNHDRLEPLDKRHGVEGRRLVRRAPDAPVVFGDLCFRNHIVTPGQVLIRKTALNTVGAFDVSLVYVEDYDLWWRLAMLVGPILVIADTVLLYRHHNSSLSGNRATVRRGAASFRWRLLTHPDMSREQKRIASTGYFYDCIAHFKFGVHYLRKGAIQHGLKHVALGTRDTLRYFRDLVRARKHIASISRSRTA